MTKSRDDTRTFSISELAREFDVTTRSIRFYEDQGLLNPTRQGQHRIYSRQDRVRLKLTLRGKRLGFSLAEIRELFDLYDADKSSRSQLQTMLGLVADKRETLQQQLEDIQMVLLELEAAEQRCRQALAHLSPEARRRARRAGNTASK
jgi:DNA-binding transcriptional MerR regulator